MVKQFFKWSTLTLLLFFYQTGLGQKLGCTSPPGEFNNRRERISFFDTAYQRNMLFDTYWETGKTLRVRIISGSVYLQQRVKTYAKQWESYANVKLEFVTNEVADIRISLTNEGYHYSYDGVKAFWVPQDQPTMVLDTSDLGNSDAAWQAVVMHQFGHALGLKHEYTPPMSGIKWNKDALHEHYEKLGFNEEQVGELIGVLGQPSSNGFHVDIKSIMSFPIPPSHTKDGFTIRWNHALSENDKNIIASIYPKHGARTNAIHSSMKNATVDMSVVQNNTKQGFSFFPSLEIQAAKSSKIYVCVLLYDEDGYSIRDTDGDYAFGETVAAGRSTHALPNEKLLANHKTSKDFELFIPYSQIPEIKEKEKIRLQLIVVEMDPSGDKKVLHKTETVSYQMVKNQNSDKASPTLVTFPAAAKS